MKSWRVKDVMEYFGEYFEYDEERVRKAMRICEGIEPGFGKLSYNQRMQSMRWHLNQQGFNIPFVSGYRRARDE